MNRSRLVKKYSGSIPFNSETAATGNQLAHAAVQTGDNTPLLALADHFDEQGHPAGHIIRKAVTKGFVGERVAQSIFGSFHSVDAGDNQGPPHDYPTLKHDAKSTPIIRFLNTPHGKFWHVKLHTSNDHHHEVKSNQSWIVPAEDQEVQEYINNLRQYGSDTDKQLATQMENVNKASITGSEYPLLYPDQLRDAGLGHLIQEHRVLPQQQGTVYPPRQLSRLKFGRAPAEDIKTLSENGIEGGQYDPNNTNDLIFADFLADHDDPREHIVRKDLEARQGSIKGMGGRFESPNFNANLRRKHAELGGGYTIHKTRGGSFIHNLSDGTSVEYMPYFAPNDENPRSYEVTWSHPKNTYIGVFAPHEVQDMIEKLQVTPGEMGEESQEPRNLSDELGTQPPRQLSRLRFAKPGSGQTHRVDIKGVPYALTKNEQGYGVIPLDNAISRVSRNYQVYCDESGNPRKCTCPDQFYRGGVCKHMKAVAELAPQEQPQEETKQPQQQQRMSRRVGPVRYSHKAFIQAIRQAKGDRTPQKVYADWIDDNDPEAATPETLETLRHSQHPIWVGRTPDGKVHAGRKWTMAEIRSHMNASGSHWFDRGTTRFFRTRIHGQPTHGPGGTYFISSEETPHNPRRFTVRGFRAGDPEANFSPQISTFQFMGHPDLESARGVAKRLASGESVDRTRMSRRFSVKRYAAGDESSLVPMFRSIPNASWRGESHADHTPRVATADLLDELGRHEEGAILRDTKKHAYLTANNGVQDAGELSKAIHKSHNQGRMTSALNYPDLRQYVETSLWASTLDDGSGMDSEFEENQIHPATMAAMMADMYHFHAMHGDKYEDSNASETDLGHDFWLSRNGHGAGFFARPEIYGDHTDDLQEAAQRHGEYNLYVGDDGMIHGSQYEVHPNPKPQQTSVDPDQEGHDQVRRGIMRGLNNTDPEQMSRRRFGRAPADDVRDIYRNGLGDGSYNPAAISHAVLADKLADYGDPREHIVRRDLEHRGSNGIEDDYWNNHDKVHEQLGSNTTHTGMSTYMLSDGSRITVFNHHPVERKVVDKPTSYSVAWSYPEPVSPESPDHLLDHGFMGAFSPEEYNDIMSRMELTPEEESGRTSYSRRRFAAYRAPAGGMVVRGTAYKGGSMIPDMTGEFMNPKKEEREEPLLKFDPAKLAKIRAKSRLKVQKMPPAVSYGDGTSGPASPPKRHYLSRKRYSADRTTVEQMLNHVRENPEDNTARGAAADALIENGRDAEARLLQSKHPIRIQLPSGHVNDTTVVANYEHTAWPGGYPMAYYPENQGVALCPNCANSYAETDPTQPVLYGEPYYEGPSMSCDSCLEEIPSAYGDPFEERPPDPGPQGPEDNYEHPRLSRRAVIRKNSLDNVTH